ncbi:hypothetical protein [Bosea sp. (in: a-proteobacteria)]|jgi:hypothetical protein|uniref:hypothetical protein n=1 Tax=Bosea sp. (in: a-proteobacteria) TaxID=1871050 RepID=UPI003F70B2CF
MKTKVEHGPDDGNDGAPAYSLDTPEDHHLAKERIQALQGSTRDEDAERELEALKQAVARWERKPSVL